MAKKYKKNYRSKRNGRGPFLMSVLIILLGIFVFSFTLNHLFDDKVQPVNPHDDQVEAHEHFIQQLLPTAKQLQQDYGILPSIVIGQAILESDWGTSELSAQYNNLFGMKSFNPNGKSVKLKTQEYRNGKWETIEANFKVYSSWEESLIDHTKLFVKGVDWDPYLYQGVLLADDYKTAAKALQVAGYATDPTYANKIIDVIEANQLAQYD